MPCFIRGRCTAWRAISTYGWKAGGMPWRHTCAVIVPVREIVYHHADFPVLKDTEIEVHFTPSWMNDFPTDRRLQKYFRENMPRQLLHTVELPEGAGRIAVPTPDMNRIYILLHIYRHLFDEGVGLRQLLDYYFVLCVPCSEEEKAQTLHMLDRLHMTRFASAVMYVLREVFGLEESRLLLPPSPLYGVRLLDEIMLAGNFGKYDGASCAGATRRRGGSSAVK